MSAAGLIRKLSKRQAQRTVIIERKNETSDNSGGTLPGWYTHLDNLPVVVQFGSASEGFTYGTDRQTSTGRMFAEPGKDIKSGDRVLYDKRYFSINGVRTPGEMRSGDPLAFMVIDIEEVSGETLEDVT